jgi:hypothetical protein
MSKGGIVVCPRPSTRRGNCGATAAQPGALIKSRSRQEPAIMLVNDPRWIDPPPLSGNDSVAIMTRPEG